MTEKILQAFKRRFEEGRGVFVGFVTAGFPRIDEFVDVLRGLQDGGVDIIEVGVPFSDPMADGPTIQNSNQIALNQGIDSLDKVLDLVSTARSEGVTVPILLMGYYNTFFVSGDDHSVGKSAKAGVDGFIVVDLPPEEGSLFLTACRQHGVSFVPLIAPTTTDERIRYLSKLADSFIYVVSVAGVTGVRSTIGPELPGLIQRLRSVTGNIPLVVGFGVGNREQFEMTEALADGVVMGSAIIKMLENAEKGKSGDAARQFASNITEARQIVPMNPKKIRSIISSPQLAKLNGVHGSDSIGRFGEFGGRFCPETLTIALEELEKVFNEARKDPKFWEEYGSFFDYIGRPSKLHVSDGLTKLCGGARIWLKREDLNHTGSHKINNALGQVLLARRLGKSRIVCETGAGQHGVATAAICAKFGLKCVVYMGAEDVRRQALNVFRLKLLGAEVIPVLAGTQTLKDAVNESMRDWVTNVCDSHLVIGSAIGPHPFPLIVRELQSIIGKETKQQMMEKMNKLPNAIIACVGGGSNSIGIFHPFIDDRSVRLIGVEAGGSGIDSGKHAATLVAGTIGVLHGTKTYVLQSESGQIQETHSISAGLDYPGVGPEHAHLKDTGRAEYVAATDKEALEGLMILSRAEGIIPALESAHAVAVATRVASEMSVDQDIVICISGRGDKDMHTVMDLLPSFGIDMAPKQ